jgi:Probable cobalt transporter subunit (CbtA)
MIATQPHPTISVQMRLISRGLLAGAMGGVVVFASARLIVEPVITASTRQHGSELFSHGLPANVGMACAVVVFGAAMGGLLATAFVVSHGRLSAIRPGTLVLLLAADAFAALSVLPSVSYPPGPLSVGDETATRIGLYLLMVGLSLTLIIGGVWVGRRLATRIGSWNATLIGAGAYAACIAAAMWLFPSADQTLRGLPANDVSAVRLSSLATQLALWATIAALFAPLANRLITEQSSLAEVLRLDDYRERLAIPAPTQALDCDTSVPPTHGRYQR